MTLYCFGIGSACQGKSLLSTSIACIYVYGKAFQLAKYLICFIVRVCCISGPGVICITGASITLLHFGICGSY